ncbi:MAG: trypsin-like peptidase domain-containing protein [Bacteroidota bacterium]
MKNILSYTLVSLMVSGLTLGLYHFSGMGKQEIIIEEKADTSASFLTTSDQPSLNYRAAQATAPANFKLAADVSMPAVVHIKSIQTVSQSMSDPFYELFGMRPKRRNSRQQVSSGSGVIISSDGFIVTNNHVIASADELTVTLSDNRSYTAKVIGTDPTTDLGLIKIEGTNFEAITLANSDNVAVGEWVLAVGNPFSLASTATAGIVSAIGRDLEIIEDRMAIESFIQTDAAVNPGNSGGALVNLEGQLIGINTAIASPTGAYAGYAFAVPANIVRKVITDLKEFGGVQRAFLGLINAESLNGELAKKERLDLTEGVLVKKLADEGGAGKAGIRPGDVIVSIDGIKIKNDAKMTELIGRNRPGDVIDVKVFRNGKYQTFNVQLTDLNGNTEVQAQGRIAVLDDLGFRLQDLTPYQLEKLGIEQGVLVSSLFAGKIKQETDMKENFIIMKVNNQNVSSAQEVIQMMEQSSSEIELVGIYPRYRNVYQYVIEK